MKNKAMSKLEVKVGDSYWLNDAGIENIKERYDATYMGSWCVKQNSGEWSDMPIEIFYVSDPDVEAGHTNYFGIFFREDDCFICDGSTAFSEPMAGMVDGDEVKVSRYRKHFIWNRDETASIDGGRDYTKTNGDPEIRTVIVEGDQFIITGAG